ncbi:MAG: VOC family protein [Terriglobia bacterium]
MNLSIHHLGIAVKDIQQTAAVYARSFGCRVESEVIHDPQQQAYVQFLRLPGDRVYLELVQPDGPNTKLSQAVARGGGLNHVCYAADDIDATCRELRQQGLILIAPPVPAVAFNGRRIAWLAGKDKVIIELVERGKEGEL